VTYYIAHGHHRYHAYRDQDRSILPCVVVGGSGELEQISIDNLIVDERAQQRKLNPDNIARLIDVLTEGHEFHDPIEVCDDLDAAIDHSCKPLNAEHGHPETRTDRERRTKRMIERHPDWSDMRVAKHCGVHHSTVASYRKQLANLASPPTRIGRDGRQRPATNAGASRANKGKCRNPSGKNGKRSTTETAEQIRQLAAEGWNSRQIADHIGTGPAWVSRIVKENGINVPADKSTRGTHHINPNRVVNETADSLAGLAIGAELVMDINDGFDPEQLPHWVESMNQSLRVLKKLHAKLKGLTNGK